MRKFSLVIAAAGAIALLSGSIGTAGPPVVNAPQVKEKVIAAEATYLAGNVTAPTILQQTRDISLVNANATTPLVTLVTENTVIRDVADRNTYGVIDGTPRWLDHPCATGIAHHGVAALTAQNDAACARPRYYPELARAAPAQNIPAVAAVLIVGIADGARIKHC